MAALLVHSGAQKECQTTAGWTALHAAAVHNWPEVIEILLAAQVQLDATVRSPAFRMYAHA